MRDICQQFVCSEFRKSLKVEDNYHECFSLVRTDPKWGSVEVSVWEGVTGVESDAPSMMAALRMVKTKSLSGGEMVHNPSPNYSSRYGGGCAKPPLAVLLALRLRINIDNFTPRTSNNNNNMSRSRVLAICCPTMGVRIRCGPLPAI